MQKKDLRNLIIIWVISILLSAVTAMGIYKMYDPAVAMAGPAPDQPVTDWVLGPATTISEAVRGNFAWTVFITFPFLYAPILLVIFIAFRFSKDRNPVPATFHEHVPLEVAWTIIPALVLVAMALPAYGVLRQMEATPKKPDVVLDIVGAQFYWQYNFPKYDVTFVDDGSGKEWLHLPVDKSILLNGQSFQVNHAWWVPAFGVKFDVIPGRITGSWMHTTREGAYKGQCAELCGALHAYMWIHVKVVPEKEFYAWLKSKGATFPPEEQEKVAALLGEDAVKEVSLAQ